MICKSYIINYGSYIECLICNSYICINCIKHLDDKLFYFDREKLLYRLKCNNCFYHNKINKIKL